MNGVNNSIYIQISALIYCILLIIIYFNKKRYNSFENKIYASLIIINFIGLVIDISLGIVSSRYLEYQALTTVLTKFYLLYFVLWISCFTFYIIAISSKKNGGIKWNTKNKLLLFFFAITLIVIYLLPVKFSITDKGIHSYGYGTTLAYVVSGIAIVICIITFFKNISLKNIKKYSPVLIFMFLGTCVMFIQYTNPTLILIPAMETFITFIMYFTIENPDMKLIEEVHRAKVISDNANEEKTLFLYNVTNDIRGIVKDINTDILTAGGELSNKKIDKEYLSECLRSIQMGTARITTMTNEMLDVSSMDGASIKVYKEKYNIRLIIKELVSNYERECSKKNIAFRYNINSDIPEYLYGDGINLKKSINILLENSVKYTKEGYVELDVNSIIKNDIVRLIITVEDSGIGIKSDNLGTLFVNKKDYREENYNLNNTLYNVKKIITLMGGTIIPSSIYGSGTKMKIILDQKLLLSNNDINKYEKEIDKKDILLIGKNNDKLITKYLKNRNVNLEVIDIGKKALDKIRGKKKYDLILLEENIEPLNGFIIMKKLLMIKSFNSKVILLSGNKNNKDIYKDNGFTDIILEPIDKDILII